MSESPSRGELILGRSEDWREPASGSRGRFSCQVILDNCGPCVGRLMRRNL